ncbi:WhiB family transcriptional regulator [Streptomyces sp. KR80]|uniref:WhiB family transcriptional regulator n=1 Tax=Streptomyces sp. KR80 TaxID=3457426 RepID=UPI003FD1A64B
MPHQSRSATVTEERPRSPRGPGPTDREPVSHPACRDVDPELFFPERRRTQDQKESTTAAAKRVCRHCSVQIQCLATATQLDEPYGIWGGTTPPERRGLGALVHRLGKLDPLIEAVRQGSEVIVSPTDHPIVVIGLTARGWSDRRIATRLGITARELFWARSMGIRAAAVASVLRRRPSRQGC